MIETMIVIGYVVGYLSAGLVVARALSVRIYRWRWDYNVRVYSEYIARTDAANEAKLFLTFIALLWPLGLVALLGLGAMWFVMAPVSERKERATQLRKDADYWAEIAREEIDDEKKSMAEELAKSLREQAEGVDLR